MTPRHLCETREVTSSWFFFLLFTDDKKAQFTFDDYLVPVAYPIGQEVAAAACWRTVYLEWDKMNGAQ